MNQATSTAGPPGLRELILPLTDPEHLFNAPRVDPTFPGPLEGLGISGFDHLLSLLHLDSKCQRARTLKLLLPPETAATASAEKITRALRRHAAWRIERELRDRRNTYRYGWRVAGFAVVVLAGCLALSSLFASEVTQGMGPLIRKTFEYGFEIIGWVILWHPIDVLVFSPVAIRARLAALQCLASLEIVIHAEPKQDSEVGGDRNAR
jgi:hypothetical protein